MKKILKLTLGEEIFLNVEVDVNDGGSAPPVCNYTYSDWGPCQSNNTQIRTVASVGPPGCVGTPDLVRSCNYIDPNPVGLPDGSKARPFKLDQVLANGNGMALHSYPQFTLREDSKFYFEVIPTPSLILFMMNVMGYNNPTLRFSYFILNKFTGYEVQTEIPLWQNSSLGFNVFNQGKFDTTKWVFGIDNPGPAWTVDIWWSW